MSSVSNNPICCLCSKSCECPYGNNPRPAYNGTDEDAVCCNKCNHTKVIPARTAHIKKWNDIRKNRLKGLYACVDTRDEAAVSARQMKDDDVVFTILHKTGTFSVYNKKEFLPQIKMWEEAKHQLLACNIKPITINDKEFWMFTIQPNNMTADNSAFCPLALAYGTLVSGYSYITKDKGLTELVHRVLGSKN